MSLQMHLTWFPEQEGCQLNLPRQSLLACLQTNILHYHQLFIIYRIGSSKAIQGRSCAESGSVLEAMHGFPPKHTFPYNRLKSAWVGASQVSAKAINQCPSPPVLALLTVYSTAWNLALHVAPEPGNSPYDSNMGF